MGQYCLQLSWMLTGTRTDTGFSAASSPWHTLDPNPFAWENPIFTAQVLRSLGCGVGSPDKGFQYPHLWGSGPGLSCTKAKTSSERSELV